MKAVHYVKVHGFLHRKDKAVSPVIATILMVAVTVVLAVTVYVMVSHYGSGGAAPISGSFAEMTSTSNSVTLQFTYTIPANMTTLNDIHMTLLSGAGTVLATLTVGSGLTVTSSSTSYTMTISNPAPGVNGALMSGSILTISGASLPGDVLDLTYSGNTGTVSVTLQ